MYYCTKMLIISATFSKLQQASHYKDQKEKKAKLEPYCNSELENDLVKNRTRNKFYVLNLL